MPSTSEPQPPPTPPPSSPSASTSYLSESIKLCSFCSLPLGPGGQVDPFLARLGDETPSSVGDHAPPMICGRCARARDEGRTLTVQQTEAEGARRREELAGGNRDDGSMDGLGGAEAGGEQQASHEMEGIRDDSRSEREQSKGQEERGRTRGVITIDGQLQSFLPPSSLSPPLDLPNELEPSPPPSLDSVVEAAYSPTVPSPPTPIPSLPSSPPSLTSTSQSQPKPPTHLNSTYILPPRRDPILDLTKRRVPSVGKDCIYPGAQFVGTQKSGRNSYDVTVTIADVDFPNSSLSGYLKISGLTEDHPVLTTFFEGEIIGPHYGFLTNRWGATETADLSHWQRFPLFRPLKSIVRKNVGWTLPSPFVASPPPLLFGLNLTGVPRSMSPERGSSNESTQPMYGGGASVPVRGTGGGCFFRFKEKFIISDRRLTSVSGASFSGFYYICVEFSSPLTPPPSVASTPANSTPASSTPASSVPPSNAASRAASPRPITPSSTYARTRSTSTGTVVPTSPTRASVPLSPTRRSSASSKQQLRQLSEENSSVMRGFYFHSSNSEPFQELNLRSVKEKVHPTFEYR